MKKTKDSKGAEEMEADVVSYQLKQAVELAISSELAFVAATRARANANSRLQELLRDADRLMKAAK